MRLKVFFIALLLFAPPVYAQDGISMAQAKLHGQTQVAAWPATVEITGVEFKDGTGDGRHIGVRLLFADEAAMKRRWPNVKPAGWDGPLLYTVWVGIRLADGWHLLPAITMYDGAWGTGAPLPRYWQDWTYFDPVFVSNPPAVGTEVAFFASAGVARFDAVTFSVAERSNVVRVKLLTNGVSRPTGAPIPPPQVPPAVPITEPPPVQPTPDALRLTFLEKTVLELSERLSEAEISLAEKITSASDRLSERIDGVDEKLARLTARVNGIFCESRVRLGFANVPVSCKVIVPED